ncbi:unnamed protein product [Cylicocyclus nassatus]|uniref:Uncharacterized protein n=1 Tax=Cylicocyclus nassatus TaxID=53992 RepID=A0AA36GEC7_CYLNA|nr:unnamed protein product [Cylicocyclus nassatus]
MLWHWIGALLLLYLSSGEICDWFKYQDPQARFNATFRNYTLKAISEKVGKNFSEILTHYSCDIEQIVWLFDGHTYGPFYGLHQLYYPNHQNIASAALSFAENNSLQLSILTSKKYFEFGCNNGTLKTFKNISYLTFENHLNYKTQLGFISTFSEDAPAAMENALLCGKKNGKPPKYNCRLEQEALAKAEDSELQITNRGFIAIGYYGSHLIKELMPIYVAHELVRHYENKTKASDFLLLTMSRTAAIIGKVNASTDC